jgi:hypothetical protein
MKTRTGGRIVGLALAVALSTGALTAVLPSSPGPSAVEVAEAGKRNCVRTGGVRWCFSRTAADFIPVIQGQSPQDFDLPRQIACQHLINESNANVFALGCDNVLNDDPLFP